MKLADPQCLLDKSPHNFFYERWKEHRKFHETPERTEPCLYPGVHYPYEKWREKAKKATVALSNFGGGPFMGYHVGGDVALEAMNIRPDVLLPGCVGLYPALHRCWDQVNGRDIPYTGMLYGELSNIPERRYRKIPENFIPQISCWMRGYVNYLTTSQAYEGLVEPEVIKNFFSAYYDWLKRPTSEWHFNNLAFWYMSSIPAMRFALGAYFNAPVGAYSQCYQPEVFPWGMGTSLVSGCGLDDIFHEKCPILVHNALGVGDEEVTLWTNCHEHPSMKPICSQSIIANGALPGLMESQVIDGKRYREGALRNAGNLSPKVLDEFPNLEAIIVIQIMTPAAAGYHEQSVMDNYSVLITEAVATIGNRDIEIAQKYLKDKGQDVEWIIIRNDGEVRPEWTKENYKVCFDKGYHDMIRELPRSKYFEIK